MGWIIRIVRVTWVAFCLGQVGFIHLIDCLTRMGSRDCVLFSSLILWMEIQLYVLKKLTWSHTLKWFGYVEPHPKVFWLCGATPTY